MSVRIITTENFRREAKKLIKKYRSLKGELSGLAEELVEDPRKGVHIGKDVYKIRLAVKSKGRGKSGGLRIITFVQFVIEDLNSEELDVYLLSIYDKSDFANISDNLLKHLIKEIQEEINKEELIDKEEEENQDEEEQNDDENE